MNGRIRILCGSLLAAFLLVLVPATNAIQVQPIEKKSDVAFYSSDTMKSMDSTALIDFMYALTEDYPVLTDTFFQCVKEVQETPISSLLTEQFGTIAHHSNQGVQKNSDNQTLLEKIYWKIFNYRVFRLYISACIFLYHQSSLTLMRTMTWGIKLLRLIKIGTLLGFITTTPQPPQQPTILFEQDTQNGTLTVLSVTPQTIPWSDIDEIGSGSCDPLPSGNVTIGDEITNCTGIIVLRYLPLDEILGVYEFD
jgi:hypothetical protein